MGQVGQCLSIKQSRDAGQRILTMDVNWMQSTFGEAYTSVNRKRTGPLSRLMKEFESNKKDFGYSRAYDENLTLTMNAPSSEHYDNEEGLVKFPEWVKTMRPFLLPNTDSTPGPR
jgi:hypothetical protein